MLVLKWLSFVLLFATSGFCVIDFQARHMNANWKNLSEKRDVGKIRWRYYITFLSFIFWALLATWK